jgi:hypothetical protein
MKPVPKNQPNSTNHTLSHHPDAIAEIKAELHRRRLGFWMTGSEIDETITALEALGYLPRDEGAEP